MTDHPTGAKRLSATVVIALIIALTAGCGATRPGFSNGSLSVCYRAIPTAQAALHQAHPHFIGVHRLSADTVANHLPPSVKAQAAPGDLDTAVCAVTFQGSFAPGQVDKANPTAQGHYAIVLVSSKHLHLVASFVLDQLPKRFKGRFI
ncbi:MAG: hypothetical protein M3R71_03645 [Actinomycetota bacterium]|nr:hypothetical protein [Actinomycetota bacterium]